MLIKELFAKDIERSIKGVIKVGQQENENLEQELDEYVVTKEITKHLSKFYTNYQKGVDGSTDKMGVWISGFFGSGKSHFLKILSCMLENKEIGGKNAIDYFEGKIDDSVLYSDMKRIANMDTEVVLFNIDSQSDFDGKNKEDGILKVFKKVLNVHRGFYGGNFGIAEMEIKLSEEGVFDAFKEHFLSIKGKTWEERRRSFRFDGDAVIKALMASSSMSEETARDWHKNCLNDYKLSINDFSLEVKRYLDSKSKNAHLVFLVDEVGQYIGDDTKLMVNLQTMAEDLGTACGGRVWVMVTSQESIDELSKNIKGDDFSKIQGRFDTRLSLSSISASEVIKKRILDKKDAPKLKLEQIYHEKSAILNNLITFKNATGDFNSFSDAHDFVTSYPFVPYQFKLLQNVFEQIRKHGSSGKHLSEGERSMLSAFKESAYTVRESEEGVLVPFQAFYTTISEFLNPSITRVIEGAKENDRLKDNEFNIDVLKILFMLKYVKEMDTNIDNIATLMVTHIDEDKLELKNKIKESLNLLIRETLVQKNGEDYIFLTDDEQDVNREIKNTKIDSELTKKHLRDMMFNELYDRKRFRYSAKYDFDFNKKMDEKNHGNQTADIGLNVLSPLSDFYGESETRLALMSSNHGDIIIKLDDTGNYIEELEEALRIDEYIKTKNISNLPENISSIINGKSAESRDRKKRARVNLEDAVKNATYYINSQQKNITGSSIKERIENALKLQVENVFIKLDYITDFLSRPEDIDFLVKEKHQQLAMDENGQNNKLALDEVMEHINLEEQMNKQIRVKLIVDKFSNKPYGWNPLDIAGVLAILLKDQKIKMRFSGTSIDETTKNIGVLLTKTSNMDTILVEKRAKIDPALLKTVKNICRDLWNTSDIPSDEDSLVIYIKEKIKDEKNEIQKYKIKYEGHKYPGESLLDKGLEHYGKLTDYKDNIELFSTIKTMEDDLLDWKDNVKYVENFFGNQKDIYDSGIDAYKIYGENKIYVDNDEINNSYEKLLKIMENPIPYRLIKDIPEHVEKINAGMESVAEEKRNEVKELVNSHKDVLTVIAGDYKETEQALKSGINEFDYIIQRANDSKEIVVIEGLKRQSDMIRTRTEDKIKQIIEDMTASADTPVTEVQPVVTPVKVKKIRRKDLFAFQSVKTEQDIDTLVDDIARKLKAELKNNDDIEFID